MRDFILNMLLDIYPVTYIDGIISVKLKNLDTFRRFVEGAKPELLVKLGKKKAFYVFKRAAKNVRHYKEFLETHNLDSSAIRAIRNFDDFLSKVPTIDKESYVKTSKFLSDMCLNEHISEAEILVRSSGFTGKPCTWPRSKEEEENARTFFTFGLDLLYHTYKYRSLFINGFALGTWVSGVDVLKASGDMCTTINPGINDDEVLDIYNTFKNEFEQVIIAGNPVFLKNLLEDGLDKGINWADCRVNLLTGGEPITEEFRDYLYGIIGAEPLTKDSCSIYSGYGASDIGITGINETFDSVHIRRLAWKDKALFAKIFGNAKTLPMLFQYDPTKYFIRKLESGELEFTTCNLDVMMPLIKYNIHDNGGLYSYADMNCILKEFKIDMKIKLPLPFIYVEGRSDNSLKFCSSFVYPENIINSIHSAKMLVKMTTGKFKMSSVVDRKRNESLLVELQLKKGIKQNNSIQKKYSRAIEETLLKENMDLTDDIKILKKKGKQIVNVRLYRYEDYPFKHELKDRYK